MRALYAVDPGVRCLGGAFFGSGVLKRGWIVRNPKGDGSLSDHMRMVRLYRDSIFSDLAPGAAKFDYFQSCHLAIEVPQVYRASKQIGDQNDLINLAIVAGGVAGLFEPELVFRYYPREWKAQVDPEVSNQRVLERLTPEELEALEDVPASLRHNMLDAVGIGLKRLGRFEPRKVFPL